MFGNYAIRNAGRDAQTRNAAYRLEGVKKTPETPKTPGVMSEMLSSTASEGRVFSGCFAEDTPKTPGGESKTPGGTTHVQDGASAAQKTEVDLDGIEHLIGATEGEL